MEYYVHNNMKYLYQNKYWSINKEYNIDKLLYLMIDRPNKIYNVEFVWTNNINQPHRNYDLPSYIYNINKTNINLYWYVNNKLHKNNNKPAYIECDGYKTYWTHGKFIKEELSK